MVVNRLLESEYAATLALSREAGSPFLLPSLWQMYDCSAGILPGPYHWPAPSAEAPLPPQLASSPRCSLLAVLVGSRHPSCVQVRACSSAAHLCMPLHPMPSFCHTAALTTRRICQDSIVEVSMKLGAGCTAAAYAQCGCGLGKP